MLKKTSLILSEVLRAEATGQKNVLIMERNGKSYLHKPKKLSPQQCAGSYRSIGRNIRNNSMIVSLGSCCALLTECTRRSDPMFIEENSYTFDTGKGEVLRYSVRC